MQTTLCSLNTYPCRGREGHRWTSVTRNTTAMAPLTELIQLLGCRGVLGGGVRGVVGGGVEASASRPPPSIFMSHSGSGGGAGAHLPRPARAGTHCHLEQRLRLGPAVSSERTAHERCCGFYSSSEGGEEKQTLLRFFQKLLLLLTVRLRSLANCERCLCPVAEQCRPSVDTCGTAGGKEMILEAQFNVNDHPLLLHCSLH